MEQVTCWQLCILCQQITSEILVCPLSNPIASVREKAYRDLLDIISQFKEEAGHCPDKKFFFLQNEQILKDASKNASWHRSYVSSSHETKIQFCTLNQLKEYPGNIMLNVEFEIAIKFSLVFKMCNVSFAHEYISVIYIISVHLTNYSANLKWGRSNNILIHPYCNFLKSC